MYQLIRGQGSPLAYLIGRKNTTFVEDVEILLPVKFRWIMFIGFRDVENVCSKLMTDDGQHVITIVHSSLRLGCTKTHCHILAKNSLICKKCKKKEEIWLSPIKSPYTHRKIQKATRQHKNDTNISITQRLRTDLTRSVGVVFNSVKNL